MQSTRRTQTGIRARPLLDVPKPRHATLYAIVFLGGLNTSSAAYKSGTFLLVTSDQARRRGHGELQVDLTYMHSPALCIHRTRHSDISPGRHYLTSQLRRDPRLGALVLVDLAPRPPPAALVRPARPLPHASAVAGTYVRSLASPSPQAEGYRGKSDAADG
ncbi:hypothetical protein BJV74DRAFT_954273 [Russula compacta]|nr:hypothetical protein BJV74DRAFT_954273 [Russula compacta]